MKNSVLKYLLCLNTLVLVLSLKKDGDNVYLLNADNLEKSVEFLDSLLVVFYSPNCQSCRDFETMLPKIGKFVQFTQCLKTTPKVSSLRAKRATLISKKPLVNLLCLL